MTSTRGNAAIFYSPDAFNVDRNDLKGRHVAGASMLAGFGKYLDVPALYCLAATNEQFTDFARTVATTSGRRGEARWISWGRLHQASEPGAVFVADPGLGRFAWQRLNVGLDRFSLCGVTHSLSSRELYELIGTTLSAPIAPWDAIVCTSRVARIVVTELLDVWTDYHHSRGWGGSPPRPQLPIIPLGVHGDRFQPANREAQRASLRARYGMAPDDVAFLFFGRLQFHAKAHPVPMLIALERAARQSKKRFFLLLAGRFPIEATELSFRRALAAYCPSVRVAIVDGQDDAACEAAWHAADVFTSLSDNIQETFGLTVIEAMAAGLPVVASDWDGYKDTVVDGETGILVPTVTPGPGIGEELAAAYNEGGATYDRYIGYAALCTAVDVEAATAAYLRLAEDGELRRRLGQGGRRRVEAVFDWRNVVPRYQELWGELADIRAAESGRHPSPAMPTRQDPFRLFRSFPTGVLGDADRLELAVDKPEALLQTLLGGDMQTFGFPVIGTEADVRLLLARLGGGPASLAALCEAETPQAARALQRCCAWLLKFGVVRRLPAPPA